MGWFIKSWEDFQHYKNRNPIWIRLYKKLLDDPQWFSLSGQDAKILVMLWLLASEDEGKKGALPDIDKIAFRFRMSEDKLTQSLQRLKHWCYQDASDMLAERKQLAPGLASETDNSETDNSDNTDTANMRVNEFEEFWKVYPRKEGKKDARKAWDKAEDKPPLSEILEAIILQSGSEQWLKDNGQFIPHPSTWLNKGKWADECKQPTNGQVVSIKSAPIPPFPGPEDPIGRSLWRKSYGDPTALRRC